MFTSIFKKEKPKNFWNVKIQEFEERPTIANVIRWKRKVHEIIEEIHETFYTEVDRLLAEAKIANSLETDKQDLIDKCNRLKALCFSKSKEIKYAEDEIERLNKLAKENSEKQILVEAIDYFSQKYPRYKFITEDSVKKICAKYNLIYGSVGRYTGTIPDKNIKHMEDFKIDFDDNCFDKYMYIQYVGSGKVWQAFVNGAEYNELNSQTSSYYIYEHHKLEIVAPLKDFNMDGMGIKSYKMSKIEIPDPVVLQPVCYHNRRYYLIVTAW